jgi:hypothetical protein
MPSAIAAPHDLRARIGGGNERVCAEPAIRRVEISHWESTLLLVRPLFILTRLAGETDVADGSDELI